MKWFDNPGIFSIAILLAFWITIFSIFSTIFDKGWNHAIIAAYVLVIALAIATTVLKSKEHFLDDNSIEEVVKRLQGGLYHFKCPNCGGFFALKKSIRNGKNPFKMTCPDCGKIAYMPTAPKILEEEIPEKKSTKTNFKCTVCKEAITIWAEGTDLCNSTQIYSCPFCGEDKPLKKV